MTDVIIPLLMSKSQIRNNFAKDANFLISAVKGSSEDIIYNTVKGDEILIVFPLPFQICNFSYFHPELLSPFFSPSPTQSLFFQ